MVQQKYPLIKDMIAHTETTVWENRILFKDFLNGLYEISSTWFTKTGMKNRAFVAGLRNNRKRIFLFY